MTDKEWAVLVEVFDLIENQVKAACRKARTKEFDFDEHTLFDWAFEFSLYQVKGYLRVCSEKDRTVKLVSAALYRRLEKELFRRLRTKTVAKKPLEDEHSLPVAGSIEEVVSGLGLTAHQEQLLLKVMYKRDGEKLRRLFASEKEGKQWEYLRGQLAQRVGGVR